MKTDLNRDNEAVHAAIARTPKDGLICVTGSLYLIGETRPMILTLADETP